MFGANLCGLDGGISFDPSLVNAVTHNRRSGGRWLGIDHGALLCASIAHDIELGGAGSLRAQNKRGHRTANDKLFPSLSPHFSSATTNGCLFLKFPVHQTRATAFQESNACLGHSK